MKVTKHCESNECLWIVHLKVVNLANSMLYVFYHNKRDMFVFISPWDLVVICYEAIADWLIHPLIVWQVSCGKDWEFDGTMNMSKRRRLTVWSAKWNLSMLKITQGVGHGRNRLLGRLTETIYQWLMASQGHCHGCTAVMGYVTWPEEFSKLKTLWKH